MRQVTLGYLVRSGEVLLAMKKRGFGSGKWNGFGGKLEPGESLEEGLVREAGEELFVTPTSFRKMAILDFCFEEIPSDEGWDQQVHVYLCDAWEGQPSESEEMAPRWFPLDMIPWNEVWSSDAYWLTRILSGHQVAGTFFFTGKGEAVREFQEREFPTEGRTR